MATPTFNWAANNMVEELDLFKAHIDMHLMDAFHNLTVDKEIIKISLALGRQGQQVYKAYTTKLTDSKASIDIFWETFMKYIQPKINPLIYRQRLFELRQEEDESVHTYIERVRKEISLCQYTCKYEAILDHIIRGTKLTEAREKILDEWNISLEDTIVILEKYESIASGRALRNKTPTICAINRNIQKKPNNNTPSNCRYCGKYHDVCPALDSTCNNCGKRNHWSSVCRHNNRMNIHTINETTNHQDTRDEVYIDINISNKTLKAKVDTGTQANVMPYSTYKTLKLTATLTSPTTSLVSYDLNPIAIHGTTTIQCSYLGLTYKLLFYIAHTHGPIIIGLPSCRSMRLVTLNCSISFNKDTQYYSMKSLLKEFPDRFTGIGLFPGTAHISTNPIIPPAIHAARRVPINIRDEVEEELNSMIAHDIIIWISEPTRWVSSLTYVCKKSRKIRICLDPKDLNKAIIRPHYVQKTLEEINHLLCNVTIFSKLDARAGYWAVKLDDESSRLTTFNTHLGRFRFKRLPFGLNLSQDIFQEHMDTMLQNIPGILNIADDIIVYGKNKEIHDHNLSLIMQQARKYGLILNPEKCIIGVPEIPFFELIYSSSGTRPDPNRTAAIRRIPPPTNIKEVRSILGIATYMAPFIPNITELLTPLRKLIHKNTPFIWTEELQGKLEQIKTILSKESCLSYFDTYKLTTIQVDASGIGIGAVLMQDNKPICFASRSLIDAEKRYANIERELLAVVYGCTKFHHYIFGKPFVIESDHKPLEMILNKHIATAQLRLQRMLLKIQNYQLKIKYRPGKELILADAFSRDPSHKQEENTQTKQCHRITINLITMTPQTETAIILASQLDPLHDSIREYISKGWPNDRSHLKKDIYPYWPYRDELIYHHGLIYKGLSVLVPSKIITYIIDKLHTAHAGVEKMRLMVKDTVYWNNMQSDLTEYINSCAQCQEFARSPWKPPSTPRELPQHAWDTVAADLLYVNGKTYLLIVDYFSKYPVLHHLQNSSTSNTIIEKMKDTFSLFGVPKTLYSDNGPQFLAPIFFQFTKEWEFKHITSSPYYPQSNGFIERQVQTIKNIIKKTPRNNIKKALLSWRHTPVDNSLRTPIQLLLHQTEKQTAIHYENLTSRQHYQINNSNKHRRKKDHPELHPGQPFNYKDIVTGKWYPGIIKQKRTETHSYDLITPNNTTTRRTRHHIHPSNKYHNNVPTDTYHYPTQPSLHPTPTTQTPLSSPLQLITNHTAPQRNTNSTASLPVINNTTAQPLLTTPPTGTSSSIGETVRPAPLVSRTIRKSDRISRPPIRYPANS